MKARNENKVVKPRLDRRTTQRPVAHVEPLEARTLMSNDGWVQLHAPTGAYGYAVGAPTGHHFALDRQNSKLAELAGGAESTQSWKSASPTASTADRSAGRRPSDRPANVSARVQQSDVHLGTPLLPTNEVLTGSYRPDLGVVPTPRGAFAQGHSSTPEQTHAPAFAGGSLPLTPPPKTAPPAVRRMLLVEDEAASRNALRTIMRRHGWEVTAVATVEDALLHLNDSVDAVILDLMLPDGDGEDVLRQIRAANLHPHVAIMSGTSDARRLMEVERMNPDQMLVKPVNLAQLLHDLPSTGGRGDAALAA